MLRTENWRNTELTTDLWRYISSGNTEEVEKMVERDARIALVRAEDGRGPLFWVSGSCCRRCGLARGTA